MSFVVFHQDERERKMKNMEERMREIELSLRNVKLLLKEKVAQLKDQVSLKCSRSSDIFNIVFYKINYLKKY